MAVVVPTGPLMVDTPTSVLSLLLMVEDIWAVVMVDITLMGAMLMTNTVVAIAEMMPITILDMAR
jgi:hypothetical protein